MAYSHTNTKAIVTAGGGLTYSKSYSGSAEVNISETIAVGTDTAVNCAIDVSAVKSFYVVSDKAITLETNSASSPTNTLVLKAGVPYTYDTDSYDTFKLTGDVTVIYVTNASGGDAALELRCVQDSTP